MIKLPSFLPSFLPFFLPFFLPSLPSFTSFLACSSGSSVSLPSRQLPPTVRSHSFGAPPKLFPRFTSHPHSSGAPVSLLPALLPAELPPKLFPRFTSNPRSSGSCLAPSCGAPRKLFELPPSYFHASHPIHTRPALLSRSFLRSCPEAISTLHTLSTLVRQSCLAPSCGAFLKHSCLAPSCGAPPKLFHLLPRFTSHPRSSGTPVSLLPAELPPSYFLPSTLVRHSSLAPSSKLFPRFTSHPRSSARPALLSRPPCGEEN